MERKFKFISFRIGENGHAVPDLTKYMNYVSTCNCPVTSFIRNIFSYDTFGTKRDLMHDCELIRVESVMRYDSPYKTSALNVEIELVGAYPDLNVLYSYEEVLELDVMQINNYHDLYLHEIVYENDCFEHTFLFSNDLTLYVKAMQMRVTTKD